MIENDLDTLLKYIEDNYPLAFLEIKDKDIINKNLFSPFILKLPIKVLTEVEKFVENIYKVKELSDYQSQLPNLDHFASWPKTPSLLTCFDFHYSNDMGLKLIEINTNAALYLTSLLQNRVAYRRPMEKEWNLLLEMFKQCFNQSEDHSVSILDENPKSEGLYFEFLIFKEWLTNNGFPTNIISLQEYDHLARKNIYNRYNDFYLNSDQSTALLNDYIQLNKTFSPNPREYFLLADKKRLPTLKATLEKQDLSSANIIPESKLFSEFIDKDDLWSQRKKYFFKPSQSYGSKGVYSGKGISRKAFDAIYEPNFMAQEICPADKKIFNINNQDIELKYDLRFFVFDGKVQHSLARLYQGQATNMRTENGGIAPIEFTN